MHNMILPRRGLCPVTYLPRNSLSRWHISAITLALPLCGRGVGYGAEKFGYVHGSLYGDAHPAGAGEGAANYRDTLIQKKKCVCRDEENNRIMSDIAAGDRAGTGTVGICAI